MNRAIRSTLVILALSASYLASAVPARAGANLGIKGGVSVAQITMDAIEPESHTGFGGGVSLGFPLGTNIQFAPELLYVRKGATFAADIVTVGGVSFGNIKGSFDLDYFEIPLLLKLDVLPIGPVKLNAIGGPTFAFKTAEKLVAEGLSGLTLSSDEIKDTDYGVMLGGGVAIPLGGLTLTGEGRYTWGLANVSDLPFGGELKNSDVLVLVGLEFKLGK